MTTLRTNPCEGTAGQTVVFTAEGADGTSVGTLTYVTGGKVGSTAAQVADGSTSFFQNVVTGSYTGFWFRAPTLPTGDNTFAYALNGSTGVAAVGMLATGAIRIYSVLSTIIATTTATCTANAWYYADWHADGSSGAPQQTFRLYDATGTLVETLTGAVNGAVAPDRWRHGHPQGGKQAGPMDFDNIRIADAYTGFPPPNVAPTASFTHSESGLTTTVTSTSSDSDGTITGYDWNWGDGTAHGTGASTTHTYASAGTRTVTLTVTDNNGATGTATASVTTSVPAVPPTTANTQAAAAIVTATSTPGGGGTVTYSIAQTSGTATTPLLISTGKWAVPRHGTDTLVYTITATESPSGLTATSSVSVTPAPSGGGSGSGGDEILTRNATNTGWTSQG